MVEGDSTLSIDSIDDKKIEFFVVKKMVMRCEVAHEGNRIGTVPNVER